MKLIYELIITGTSLQLPRHLFEKSVSGFHKCHEGSEHSAQALDEEGYLYMFQQNHSSNMAPTTR